MRLRTLSLAITAALSMPVVAQEGAPSATAVPDASSSGSPVIPLTYVRANTRFSIGIDDEGDFSGEILQVLGYDGARAFLAEGWFGRAGSGGAKMAFNWLWGKTAREAIDDPDSVYVTKGFLAYDRNEWEDDKLTLGFGLERKDVFGSVYYMHGLSDERAIATRIATSSQTITGTDNGRPFTQERFTDNLFTTFEEAWDHGFGVRGGRFFNDNLWRLRGGLDYEKGDFSSDQFTGSVGVDKYFENSGHSVSLELQHLSRDGDFIVDDNETRLGFFYRYEWGQSFRPAVWENQGAAPAAAPVEERAVVAEPKIIHNEIKLSSDAFFDFDKSELRPETRAELDALIERIRREKLGSPISIVGHTCSIGTDQYNQGLSERRASAVRQYFLDAGIREELIVDGKGEAEPEFPNDNRENRKKNRRVDIDFVTIEDTTVPGEEIKVNEGTTNATWTKQQIDVPAGWVERALKNIPEHKRQVDVYQYEQQTGTTTRDGPRVFLNRPPVAANDTASIARNATGTLINVLANDSDPDNNPLVITTVTQPANGSVQNVGNGVVFTPAQNFTGVTTFTYTISDGQGGTATATVTVTVADTAPTAADDTANTGRNTPVDINVLANDRDPDGTTLTITAVTQPANGRAEIVGTQVRYTPNQRFAGTDRFTYTIRDAAGNTATANVTVTVANAAPIAADDAANAMAGVPVTIDVLANDRDPDSDPITIAALGPVANGSARIEGNRVIYTANAGFTGTDSFTYTVRDEFGATATATVRVTVAANRAPVAVADSASTTKANTVVINVLANDTDPEGDTLSLTRIVGAPTLGRATVNADGTVTYTHNPGPIGIDTFTYEVSDGRGNVAVGTVTVTIIRVPNP